MEIVFEELFEKNQWKPLDFKGRSIQIADKMELPLTKVRITIIFERANSEWEQGVFFRGGGDFLVNDEHLKDAFYLWRDASPEIIEIVFNSRKGELLLWNIWRIDNGPMQYGHNGAALYYERIPNGKRYFCNDGYPDDDFDDLIFTVQVTPVVGSVQEEEG